MPKRFTDTEKWRKPFIKSLPAPYKLLWFYILDDCDTAGIWPVDLEVAAIRIGEHVTEKLALQYFQDKVIRIDGGQKWFIPAFIEFQYPGGLQKNNRAHINALRSLEKYKTEIEGASKDLASPLQGSSIDPALGAVVLDMVMDMDKDMVKEEKPKKTKKQDPVLYPWDTPQFFTTWENWKNYKHQQFGFKYKPAGEQSALMHLAELSGGDQEKALAIIRQSMANGWKGFFELKINGNGKQQNGTNWDQRKLDANQAFNDFWAERERIGN